jgi:ASC-1-like (ASCH) protein
MKLPIKQKYFDKIKSGEKKIEFRDAHITFVCEETGEILVKFVRSCHVENRDKDIYSDVLSDERMIVFYLIDKINAGQG